MRAGDTDAFAALFAQLQMRHGVVTAGDRAALGQDSQSDREQEAIIAEVEGRMVGFAVTSLQANPLGREGIYLNELFVAHAFRDEGVGSLLVDHVKQMACADGLGPIRFGYPEDHSRFALLSQEPAALAKALTR
jgi:GNAT superfamily N-acetyltransferase